MNIIVGTWQLGGSSWATVKEADVYKTIEQTIQLGCRHFDTAPTYGDGRSESALGKILSEAPSYKFTITTKVSPDQLKFDQLVKSVELSLQRLKVSSVGNLLIHWPAGTMNTEMVSLEEISRGLEYIKKQGYAEKIGVCNYSLLELNNLEKLISLDTVQYPLSAVYRVVEPEILNHVLEKKYDIQAYSPLGQGLLAPKKQITKPQDGDHRNWVRLYNKSDLLEECLVIRKKLIEKFDPDNFSSACLAWIIRKGATPIIGLHKPEHLELIKKSEFNLSQEEFDFIDTITTNLKNKIQDISMWG